MSSKTDNAQSKEQKESHKSTRSTGKFLKKNWFTILVLLYLVSPIDLIPEGLIPVAGQTDDALLALFELVRKWVSYKKEK